MLDLDFFNIDQEPDRTDKLPENLQTETLSPSIFHSQQQQHGVYDQRL